MSKIRPEIEVAILQEKCIFRSLSAVAVVFPPI